MHAARKTKERLELERRAAAALELKRRKQARLSSEKTTFGIYEPTTHFGGRLLRVIQEVDGEYIEVDKEPLVKVPLKLEPVVTKPKRIKVLFGGRSAAKTNTIADIRLAHAKDYGYKTLCLRELQNSIDDSVHAILASEIERLGLPDFDTVNSAIRYKGKDAFKFRGVARNSEAVKSMFGFQASWGEEAQTFSEESLRTLTPTIRDAGSEIWFSLNPGSSEDPFSKRFLMPFWADLERDGYYEDDLHLIIWINYRDNPWHSHELETEREWDKRNLSRALYDHIWEGHFNDTVEAPLILPEWFDACIDAHKKLGFEPEGAKYASHDPSDEGPDSKGYGLRHGSVITNLQEMLTGNANEGARWACGLAIQDQADYFIWDGDGLGAPLREPVAASFKGKKVEADMFKGSEGVDSPTAIYQPVDGVKGGRSNKDTFKNKRAQYYQTLRDRCFKTFIAVEEGKYTDPDELISFSSEIQCLSKLRSELCRMPIKPNGNGYIELYTKDIMKTRFKLPSPNLGDTVMMLMKTPAPKRQAYIPKPITPKGKRNGSRRT